MWFMPEGKWRERLTNELKAKKLSWRSVSLKAGMSEGYLAAVLTEGKDPIFSNLVAICDAAGLSPAYILLGLPAERETERVLRAYARMSKVQREAFLALLGAEPPDEQ